MFEDLITYDELLEASEEMFGFSGVTMLRDFGPLKKGDKFDSVFFIFESAKVQAGMETGGKPNIIEFSFRLEA